VFFSPRRLQWLAPDHVKKYKFDNDDNKLLSSRTDEKVAAKDAATSIWQLMVPHSDGKGKKQTQFPIATFSPEKKDVLTWT
jgi:hypothetical protein